MVLLSKRLTPNWHRFFKVGSVAINISAARPNDLQSAGAVMDEEAEAPEEVDVAVTCWPDCSHDRGRGDLPPGCFVCFPS